MGEKRHFCSLKLINDASAKATRGVLEKLETTLTDWHESQPQFQYATQLASKWQAGGNGRLSMLIKFKDIEERWYARVSAGTVPHVLLATTRLNLKSGEEQVFPMKPLVEVMLEQQAIDSSIPDPGREILGYTASMYLRYKLESLSGGRELFLAQRRPSNGRDFKAIRQLAHRVFSEMGRDRSKIEFAKGSIRRFILSCDELLLKSEPEKVIDALRGAPISPTVWFAGNSGLR